MKKLLVIFLCFAMLFAFAACSDESDTSNIDGANSQAEANAKIVLPDVVKGTMTFKDYGIITFEIYPNMARQSCLNFIYLVNSGHFNGVIVDRLVKDFVIQAGQYEKGYLRRETEFSYTIKGEFSENGIENNLHHMKGTLSWARSGDDYNSASTELCIYTSSENTWDLDGKYAAFGMVTDGFDVLKKINKVKTYAEKPTKEIVISSVSLEPLNDSDFGQDFEFPKPDFIMTEDKKDDSKSEG